MKSLEELLEKKWILRTADKDLYYRVRDDLGDIRKFATEKLGCQIVENSLLVKLEKIPAKPESFMGIEAFTSVTEYAFLCMILMFLEDKEVEEQFILSQLTEYISSNMPSTDAVQTNTPSATVDWNSYTNRRQLIKALRYSMLHGMIRITDGSDDVFMDASGGEVLYENTGASRYFMRNFTRDITEYSVPQDFEQSEWFDVNEDRGIMRRNRVYKKLLFSVGMRRENDNDEDFSYLKNYGKRLAEELEQIFDCSLHIHRSGAYLLLGDNCRIGKTYPEQSMLSDIILLLAAMIRERADEGALTIMQDETIHMDEFEFGNLVRECKEKYNSGFSKEFREMPTEQFVVTVTAEMVRLTFVEQENRTIAIHPIAVKITGAYPEDFMSKT